MPMQFHMPRRQPYFMPADMDESAPGPGEKQRSMAAMKKVSQVAKVIVACYPKKLFVISNPA